MPTIESDEKCELWCDENGDYGLWLPFIERQVLFKKNCMAATKMFHVLKKSENWLVATQPFFMVSGHSDCRFHWEQLKLYIHFRNPKDCWNMKNYVQAVDSYA